MQASSAKHTENTRQDSSMQAERQRVTVVPRSYILTLDDPLEVEVAIICYSQRQRFSEKIYALSSRKATVSRQSSIYRLDPILEDGLLRVEGRLSKGVMPEEVKHQLILSKDQHISMLLLKHVHHVHSGSWWTGSHIVDSKEDVLDHQHQFSRKEDHC